MDIINQSEEFRSLKNINFNDIISILVEQCEELEQDLDKIYIDKRFTFETINGFNKRQINPDNINDIIELCNYLQIEETVKFIINNCDPSDNYKIDEKYLEDLEFPLFITNFEKNLKIIDEICVLFEVICDNWDELVVRCCTLF